MIELYRCPSQTLGEAPPQTRLAVDLLMRCYLQFDGRHVLPVDGGLINQTRSFVSGCEIIDGERGRYEEMKETKREHDKLTAQRKGKVGRHGR